MRTKPQYPPRSLTFFTEHMGEDAVNQARGLVETANNIGDTLCPSCNHYNLQDALKEDALSPYSHLNKIVLGCLAQLIKHGAITVNQDKLRLDVNEDAVIQSIIDQSNT
jgi:hypothetical protein